MRRAANIDKNQPAIVSALRQLGIAVEIIGKPVDLLCWHRGRYYLLEVKNPDGFDRITKEQAEFMARWPGAVFIVRSVEEAIRAVVGEEMLA